MQRTGLVVCAAALLLSAAVDDANAGPAAVSEAARLGTADAAWTPVADAERTPEYTFIGRQRYYEGVGVKIEVKDGLSKEAVRAAVGDAGRKYGGNEGITVWVYRAGDDVGATGFTVAMGEYIRSTDTWQMTYAKPYFGEVDAKPEPPHVGQRVTLQAGTTISNDPEKAFDENVILTTKRDTPGTVVAVHKQDFGGGVALTTYQVRLEGANDATGWVSPGDILDK